MNSSPIHTREIHYHTTLMAEKFACFISHAERSFFPKKSFVAVGLLDVRDASACQRLCILQGHRGQCQHQHEFCPPPPPGKNTYHQEVRGFNSQEKTPATTLRLYHHLYIPNKHRTH